MRPQSSKRDRESLLRRGRIARQRRKLRAANRAAVEKERRKAKAEKREKTA